MKIIVLSHPKDDHAAPVVWALAQAGYQAGCWSGVSWTEQEQASLLPGRQPRIFLGPFELETGDAVWLRQPDAPGHGLEVSHAGQQSAASAYSAFFDSVAYMLEAFPVRCVNTYSGSHLVRNKGVQLYLASACGLRVPETLMSNSAPAARHFFDQYPDHAICKPFAGHIWQQQGSEDIAVTETFCLTREQLPSDDEVFTYAPAIYQQMVSKEFDVRVVMMGERIYSFALRTPDNSLDWRYDAAARKLSVEIIRTPPDVEAGLHLFAQKTGSCFGVLDFAVDRSGAWWFLEINEQGQFLWLDRFNAQAGLLEKFCAFLTATPGSGPSLEERQERFPSLAEYERCHPNEEALDITAAVEGADYKSMEPGK
jgi:glutathione synthase/RimK-type ligase-like ATP-grasp enzyme